MIPAGVATVLQGVPQIENRLPLNEFSRPNFNLGSPEALMIQNKQSLVRIARSMGFRNVQRLRKFTLVCSIWLNIRSATRAECFSWLSDIAGGARMDSVRYLLQHYYSDTIPILPGFQNYTFTETTNFLELPRYRVLFSFAAHYYYSMLSFYSPALNTNDIRNFDTLCRERAATVFFSMPWDRPSLTASRRRRSVRTRQRSTAELYNLATMGGSRNAPPTPTRIIEKIPEHIKIEYIRMMGKLNIRHDCPICLDTIEDDNHLTNCGHMFHTACIIQVRNDSCPTCRKQLNMT